MKRIYVRNTDYNRAGKSGMIEVIIITILFLSLSAVTMAQPYLDIANLKYTNNPDAGLVNRNKSKLQLRYFGLGTNLPITFNNKKDAIIFSPFFESWASTVNNNKRQNYYSVALPVSLSKTIRDTS